ncbi:MAG: alkyl hydroperoxide reductase/thiol specific antioxidant/Mal allergen [Chitinophagaceae bacterium]|nr:MAG: alkyl hydroperoxide reductase/thiol specific antioxidant/Mal allergen [Chitinophagaceae bacterium]
MKYIILCFLFFCNSLYAADISIYIIVDKPSDFEELYFIKSGMKSHLNYSTNKTFFITKNENTKYIKMNLPSDGFYTLSDGYKGHMIYIMNNDSIKFSFSKIPNIQEQLNKGKFFPTLHTMQVQTKFKGNYIYFDQIFAKLKYPIRFKGIDIENALVFKKRCDSAKSAALELLNLYKKTELISDSFYKNALLQLESFYILSICEIYAFAPKKFIPENYLDSAKSFRINDSLMGLISDEYVMANSVYNFYIATDYNLKKPYDKIVELYSNAKKNYSGLFRDLIMSYLLVDYPDQGNQIHDSLFSDYSKECKNLNIRTKYSNKIISNKQALVFNKIIDYEMIYLAKELEDINGQLLSLKDITQNKNKIIVLDFWASWCAPCLKQMPIIKQIRKEQNNSFNIVSLSIDEEKKDWKNAVFEKKIIGEHYLVTKPLKLLITKYFNITTIPRYILISAKGTRVLNDRMSSPLFKDAFRNEILEQ